MTGTTIETATEAERSPAFAALLSLVFSRLGHAYNGQFGRGVLILAGTQVGILVFALMGTLVWIYGIY